jgi:hypothetical protein
LVVETLVEVVVLVVVEELLDEVLDVLPPNTPKPHKMANVSRARPMITPMIQQVLLQRNSSSALLAVVDTGTVGAL